MTNDQEALVQVNLTYCLVDIMESALKDMNEKNRKAGKELKFSEKMNFNKAMAGLNSLKNKVSKCPDDEQEAYGNDSDMLYQFLKLLIDRCGENDRLLYHFYNHIKAFPSAMGMDLEKGETRAFGFID